MPYYKIIGTIQKDDAPVEFTIKAPTESDAHQQARSMDLKVHSLVHATPPPNEQHPYSRTGFGYILASLALFIIGFGAMVWAIYLTHRPLTHSPPYFLIFGITLTSAATLILIANILKPNHTPPEN